MSAIRTLLVILFACLFSVAAIAKDGPYDVSEMLGEWGDKARDRQVPFKIYLPKEAPGARPIVIFSHGLGGSREGAAYLGHYLASYGYVCVHIQHPGSDESIWKGSPNPMESMRNWFKSPMEVWRQAQARFLDLPLAIDALSIMNAEDPRLRGRLDLSRIGMSGHSFGAISTLAAAGQQMGPARLASSYAEPRIKAAIALSPSPPQRRTDYATLYAGIRVPILHITGTEDKDPVGERFPPEARFIPFENITTTDQYLLVINGATHMTFGGSERLSFIPKAEHLHLVEMVSLAFWDAYLLDDPKAKAWLSRAAAGAIGAQGTFTAKLARPG